MADAEPTSPRRPTGGDLRGLAIASAAVGEMVVPILIGRWVDNEYGAGPIGLAVGAVVGVVGGTAHLVVMARRAGRRR